ncbi:MAG: hypothetical protein ACTSX4_01265 [Candidatus Helarchaeota archaeon]
MINVDILGYYDEEKISKLNLLDIEFFEIEKLVEGEKFQDILIVSIPTKKGKIRKKGYKKEEIRIINKYLENGGNVILLYPINKKYFNLMDEFFEILDFSAVLNEEEKLLHVNPNLIFYEKTKDGKFIPGKRFVNKYVHFLFPHKVETIIEGGYSPVVALKRVQRGNLFLYGMGYNNFWKEDVSKIFKYLLLKYEDLIQKLEKDQDYIIETLNHSSKFKQNLILKIYSREFKKTHSIREILSIKNDFLRQKIANSLTDKEFYEHFKSLSENKIENDYLEFKNIFQENNYNNALYYLNKVMVKFIVKHKISFEKFRVLVENNHLPNEALSLIIYFTKPLSLDDFRNYRENVNKLIHWNRKVKYLSEKKIKEKFYEVSRYEDEQLKKWDEIKRREREKEFQIREQRRKEREKRDKMLQEMEREIQEKQKIKEMIQQERLEKEKEKAEKLRQLRIQKIEKERLELLKKQKEREKRFAEIKQKKLAEKRRKQLEIEERMKKEEEKLEILKERRKKLEQQKLEKDFQLKKELENQEAYMKDVRERLKKRLVDIEKRKQERLEKARLSREKLNELKMQRYAKLEAIKKAEAQEKLIPKEEIIVEAPPATQTKPEDVEATLEAELVPHIDEPALTDDEILEEIIFPLINLILSPLYSIIEIIDFRQSNRKEILFKSDEGETLLYLLELFLTPKERILESLELKSEMEDLF